MTKCGQFYIPCNHLHLSASLRGRRDCFVSLRMMSDGNKARVINDSMFVTDVHFYRGSCQLKMCYGVLSKGKQFLQRWVKLFSVVSLKS